MKDKRDKSPKRRDKLQFDNQQLADYFDAYWKPGLINQKLDSIYNTLRQDRSVKKIKRELYQMNKDLIRKTIIDHNLEGVNLLYHHVAWYNSAHSVMVKNIGILHILIDQFKCNQIRVNSVSLIEKDDLDLVVERKDNIIHVSGVKIKEGDEFVTDARLWIALRSAVLEPLSKFSFFNVSYDITAEGQIVNYVSKERPDIAKDLGLTL